MPLLVSACFQRRLVSYAKLWCLSRSCSCCLRTGATLQLITVSCPGDVCGFGFSMLLEAANRLRESTKSSGSEGLWLLIWEVVCSQGENKFESFTQKAQILLKECSRLYPKTEGRGLNVDGGLHLATPDDAHGGWGDTRTCQLTLNRDQNC